MFNYVKTALNTPEILQSSLQKFVCTMLRLALIVATITVCVGLVIFVLTH